MGHWLMKRKDMFYLYGVEHTEIAIYITIIFHLLKFLLHFNNLRTMFLQLLTLTIYVCVCVCVCVCFQVGKKHAHIYFGLTIHQTFQANSTNIENPA